MLYSIEILAANGGARAETIEAPDQNSAIIAVRRILQNGESIIQCREAKKGARPNKGKRFSDEVLSDMCYDMHELLSGGLPLTKACEILATTNTDPAMIGMLTRVRSRLLAGAGLAEVFEAERPLIDDVFISLVTQGEATKGLAESFATMAGILDREQKRRATLVNELSMPLLSLAIGVLIFFGSFMFVVPLAREQMGSAKPDMFSLAAFAISDFLNGYWKIWAPLGFVALYVFGREPRFRDLVISYVISKWSVARKAFHSVYYADFCLLFGSMVTAGIKDFTALEITARRFGGKPLANQLLRAAEACKTGAGLSDALQLHTSLDPRVLAAVRTASESKNLGPNLTNYSNMLYFRADRAFAKFSRLFTLMVILAVLLVALFIWIVTYAPIWQSLQAQLNNQV